MKLTKMLGLDLTEVPWVLESDEELVSNGGSWTELELLDANGGWNKRRCERYAPNICRVLSSPTLGELMGPARGMEPGERPGQVTILRLSPGTRLKMHTGPTNRRLILHLGTSSFQSSFFFYRILFQNLSQTLYNIQNSIGGARESADLSWMPRAWCVWRRWQRKGTGMVWLEGGQSSSIR